MFHASPPITVMQGRDYYEHEYARGDYYTEGSAEKVRAGWYGRGAEDLGLRGTIRREDFAAVLEGRSREGGAQLIASEVGTDKHRAGWDFTASADKSVSLMSLVGGDERLGEAHRRSVDKALSELERYAQVKDKGRQRETTGRVVVAKFEHESSRKLDPQLHTHAVVMNMSRRGDGQWRALEPRALFGAQSLATATYRAEMARELQRLGYEVVVRKDGSVGIAGFTQAQLDHFSRRRKDIEAYLSRHGLGDRAGTAQQAAVSTRRAKVRDVDRASLTGAWRERAQALGLDLGAIRARAERALSEGRAFGVEAEAAAAAHARESVAFAVQHVSERRAVFQGRELDVAALKHGMGRVVLDEVRAAVAARPDVIRVKDPRVPSDLVTTTAALRLERGNIRLMRAGQGASWSVPDFRPMRPMSADQEGAARFVLGSGDQFVGITGKAGTGKTFVMEEVRIGAEGAGARVRGFAPTTGATKLLSEAGIESKTVAALAHEKPAPSAQRELWIVDEAGLLSSRQARAVLEQAKQAGAKVVFVGDTRQHHAVEAGNPFAYLQRSGMRTESLREIRRQQDEGLRAAVRHASEGRVKESLRLLEDQGRVREVADARERHRAIAQEAAKEPRKTLVVAPSNAERRELNHLIREELIAAGRIERESVKAEVAVSKGLTLEKKGEARSYEVGDRVKFFRSSGVYGVKAGEEGRVAHVDPGRGRVGVRLEDGRVADVEPKRFRAVEVSSVEERRFAVGDRVQFREPVREQRVANGELGTIKALDHATGKAEIRLDGGKRRVEVGLKDRPVALDHAYAVTSHSSQGKSVDRVLVTVDTRQSRELVNKEQFYVSVSRARKDAVVFTDDRKELASAVGREGGKGSAVDLMEKRRNEGVGHASARDERVSDRGRSGDRAAGRAVAGAVAGERSVGSARGADAGRGRGAEGGAARERAAGVSRGDAGAAGGRAASAGRDAGAAAARDAGGRGAGVGADRGEVSRAGGRAVAPGRVAAKADRESGVAADAHARGGAGRDAGRGADAVASRGLGRPTEGGARSRIAAAGAGVGRAAGVRPEGARAGIDEVRRMQIRSEEHRALRDVLPDDVRAGAVRLNVAAREGGGASVITPSRARELGGEGVKKLVVESAGDPSRAARLLAQRAAERVVSVARGPERDDGRER